MFHKIYSNVYIKRFDPSFCDESSRFIGLLYKNGTVSAIYSSPQIQTLFTNDVIGQITLNALDLDVISSIIEKRYAVFIKKSSISERGSCWPSYYWMGQSNRL